MRFGQYTFVVALGILALTALHTLVYSGLSGLLFTAAIGLLLMAFMDPFELVVSLTVLFALFYTIVLKKYMVRLEPFQDSTDEIVSRVASFGSPSMAKKKSPMGVYSSSAVEGFEDVQPDVPKEGASSEGSSASTERGNEVDHKKVEEVTSAVSKEDKGKGNKQNDSSVIAHEEFQSATNELFKLGKMPSEYKEGPLLDAGQTVMKAMNSLDPNTISNMTNDTKKLLETQKGLMSMLNQMRPVLADGKELLQTFSGMFGSGSPVKL